MMQKIVAIPVVIVALCLVYAAPAEAAIAYIKSTTATTASGTSHAITHTSTTAGSLLRACARIGSETITLTIADDKGNTWNLEQGPIDHANGGVTLRGYCWWAPNVASGNTVITVTSSATTQCRCTVDEYSGADPTDPFDVATANNNILSSAAPSVSHTPTAAGPGIVVGTFIAAAACSAPQFTAGSGFTHRANGDVIETEDKGYTGVSAITVDATCGSAQHWIVLAATYFETPVPSAAEATFLQAAADATNASTYTFTDQNIGAADAARCIIAAVHGRVGGTAALSITSVTIGGVTALLPVQESGQVSNSNIAGFAKAAVPTGTTATVVVVFNQTMIDAAIGLWSTSGLDCTLVAHDTATSEATNPSVTLDVPTNGFALAACTFGFAHTATWTGVTERYDAVVETNMHYTGAGDNFTDAQSNRTLTCDSTGTGDPVGVFASWGPEPDPDPPTGAPDDNCIIGGGFICAAASVLDAPYLLQSIICSSRERLYAAMLSDRRRPPFGPHRLGLCSSRSA